MRVTKPVMKLVFKMCTIVMILTHFCELKCLDENMKNIDAFIQLISEECRELQYQSPCISSQSKCLRNQSNSREDDEASEEKSKIKTSVIAKISNPGSNTSYDVIRILGKGGFGFCFEVHEVLGTRVAKYAMKIIDKTSQTDNIAKNEEIKIHSTLHNPHVVELFSFFECEESIYIVLELCSCNLKEFAAHECYEGITASQCRNFSQQILTGLDYIHKQNIIHRDIKPENVLVHVNILKITDFGLAVAKSDPNFKYKHELEFCGTPRYISPEIITYTGWDYLSDVWSLGIGIFRLHFGTYPFNGDSDSKLYRNILKGKLVFPKTIGNDFQEFFEKTLTSISNRWVISDLLKMSFFNPNVQESSNIFIQTLKSEKISLL